MTLLLVFTVKLFIIILNEKLSRQLGNGKLLNQLTKKNVVFDFRRNDILKWWAGRAINSSFSSPFD